MPARCIGAITPNLALLYHRNVRPIDIYLARLTLEVVGVTTSFTFLVMFFSFIGWVDLPEDVLQIAGAWCMLAWFGGGLALFLGALSETSETVEKLWHPTAYILFPLSGAAFMVDSLPETAQKAVLALPMVHGVEFLREGYFGSQFVAHYDIAYMALFNTALTLLGLAQTRKVSRILVPE
jgi:ABC-type polysaccharide/polyol phosphate export permease